MSCLNRINQSNVSENWKCDKSVCFDKFMLHELWLRWKANSRNEIQFECWSADYEFPILVRCDGQSSLSVFIISLCLYQHTVTKSLSIDMLIHNWIIHVCVYVCDVCFACNFSIFSYSCGYRKAFEEYATLINQRYPHILVTGANYDPPGLNYLLNKLIFVAKMALIIIIVTSYDIWNVFGQAIPRWYSWCTENKIYACMMVFFLGNVFEAQVNIWWIGLIFNEHLFVQWKRSVCRW